MPDTLILAREEPRRYAGPLAKSNQKPSKGGKWIFPICRCGDASNRAAWTEAAPFHKFVFAAGWHPCQGWSHNPMQADEPRRNRAVQRQLQELHSSKTLATLRQAGDGTDSTDWKPRGVFSHQVSSNSWERGGKSKLWERLHMDPYAWTHRRKGAHESKGVSDLETQVLRTHHFFSVVWS